MANSVLPFIPNKSSGILVVPPFDCKWLEGADMGLRQGAGCLSFQVKGQNDATVILSTTPGSKRLPYSEKSNSVGSPHRLSADLSRAASDAESTQQGTVSGRVCTIILGSHGNSKFKVEQDENDVVLRHDLPQARLDPTAFKPFWLNLDAGVLSVGAGSPGCGMFFRWANPTLEALAGSPLYVGLSCWDHHVGYRNVLVTPPLTTLLNTLDASTHADRLASLAIATLASTITAPQAPSSPRKPTPAPPQTPTHAPMPATSTPEKAQPRAEADGLSLVEMVCHVLVYLELSWRTSHVLWDQCVDVLAQRFSEAVHNAPAALALLPPAALLQALSSAHLLSSEADAFLAIERWAYGGHPTPHVGAFEPFRGHRRTTSCGAAAAPVQLISDDSAQHDAAAGAASGAAAPGACGAQTSVFVTAPAHAANDAVGFAPPCRPNLGANGIKEIGKEGRSGGDDAAACSEASLGAENRANSEASGTSGGVQDDPRLELTHGGDGQGNHARGLDAEVGTSGGGDATNGMQHVAPEFPRLQRDASDVFACLERVKFPLMSASEQARIRASPLWRDVPALHALLEEADTDDAAVADAPESPQRAAVAAAAPHSLTDLLRSSRRQRRCPAGARELLYISDGDQHGVLYYLGASEGRSAWMNPHLTGAVRVQSSSPFGTFSDPRRLVSRCYHGSLCAEPRALGADRASFWAIDLGPTHRLACNHYTLRHNDSSDFPRHWSLQGSEDGSVWHDLRQHEQDDSFCAPGQFHSWAVDQSSLSFFRHFRVFMRAGAHGGPQNLNLNYVELYGYLMSTSI